MASRTFHPFPRLPKELRDIIWALSIRPERPSAHFFTVFDSDNETEWSALSHLAMGVELQPRCSLAAPRCNTSDNQQLSWAKGNRSGYMIDSGMWTACKESREAVENRFRTVEWNFKRRTTDLPRNYKNLPDAPATGYFISNGEWQYCTTYPKSDLFCLQPFNVKTIAWQNLYVSVPIFDPCQKFYVSHIAIDYDPRWLNPVLQYLEGWYLGIGALGCAIRAATEELEWAENLWFIDYRIRRCPDAPPMMKDTTTSRHRFYGNGCSFTEVQEGDLEWDIDCSNDVFKFLKQLDKHMDIHFRAQIYTVRGEEGRIFHFGAPNIGALAYEVDGP